MSKSRSLRAGLVAMTLALGAAIVPVGATTPVGAADAAPKILGYTLLLGSGALQCDLATIDWASGAVTDLPAPTSADACAMDLAAAPNGTVYGLDIISYLASASPSPGLVKYAADGTATRIPLVLPTGYDLAGFRPNPMSGLAIDAAGTIFVLIDALNVEYANCLPYNNGGSVPALDDGTGFTPCLFTVDPATGAMTLVGPSTLTNGEMIELMTIASDATWTAVSDAVIRSVPTSFHPSPVATLLWSKVNRANGAVTQSVVPVDTMGGGYDALPTGTTVYQLMMVDGDDHPWTGTVDPATGLLTRIARMSAAGSTMSGMSLAVVAVPEPVPDVPKFTG